ncbi:PREDICTED: E3 ubiquitin-protein ligase listerin-like [Rhagoletis zephyria]|uniref:E3 ubiquitin-protein ligase listerin-like n=1 Tax=Rhagoletis zephyria TaxID=28612 RepID=UPI0008115D76|nr:PREDICTED: E3 ubiquitin-protein ligase listerin-like [Rhagoletis zephyria]
MDNKFKSSSRVRNNAKPSSSSRSAELLGSQTSICFPTQLKNKNVSNKRMTSSEYHINECTPNTNLHIAMRKLNKKDPITKKKALEELIDDINYASLEEVGQILSLWSKIYLDLAHNPAHNVRELTQEVQKVLALKCKRMMAPYLKQLVPVWLFSQFDNYAPAAKIARSSFYDIFNAKSNRIQEVCLHCQLEILDHIQDILSWPPKKFDKQSTEDSSLYHNLIYGSLEMLAFFTKHTKITELSSKSHIILRIILEHENFWNYGKRGSNMLRLHVDEEEIINEMKDQHVTGVYKFSKIIKGERTITGQMVLTFDLYRLPETVDVAWYKVKVQPYIPSPMRLSKDTATTSPQNQNSNNLESSIITEATTLVVPQNQQKEQPPKEQPLKQQQPTTSNNANFSLASKNPNPVALPSSTSQTNQTTMSPISLFTQTLLKNNDYFIKSVENLDNPTNLSADDLQH